MSSYSWCLGFCPHLNSRDSHQLSSHLQFFLYFCSNCCGGLQWRGQAGPEQRAGSHQAGEGWLHCSLVPASMPLHFWSLLCRPSVPRNTMGSGRRGVRFKISKTRREACCSVQSTSLKVNVACPRAWSPWRSMGANFDQLYCQRGLLSAPRSEARASGNGSDGCAFIFCALIHLRKTWHPNRDREIRGKSEKARS